MPDILDIAKLVIPLVAGIAAGYFLKERKRLNLNKITSAIILVFDFFPRLHHGLK